MQEILDQTSSGNALPEKNIDELQHLKQLESNLTRQLGNKSTEVEKEYMSNIEAISNLKTKMEAAHCNIIDDENIKQAYADNERYRLAIKLFNEFDHTKTRVTEKTTNRVQEKPEEALFGFSLF